MRRVAEEVDDGNPIELVTALNEKTSVACKRCGVTADQGDQVGFSCDEHVTTRCFQTGTGRIGNGHTNRLGAPPFKDGGYDFAVRTEVV